MNHGLAFRRTVILLAFVLPAALAAQPPLEPTLQPAGRFALRAARLVDGTSDSLRHDAVVVIEGERIAAVGGSELLAAGLEVIDLGDATLLPGLVDVHSHPLIASATPRRSKLCAASRPSRTTCAPVGRRCASPATPMSSMPTSTSAARSIRVSSRGRA